MPANLITLMKQSKLLKDTKYPKPCKIIDNLNWAISIEELVFTITNFQKTNLNNEKFKYRKG